MDSGFQKHDQMCIFLSRRTVISLAHLRYLQAGKCSPTAWQLFPYELPLKAQENWMHHKKNWMLNVRLPRYYLKNTPNKKIYVHRTWSIKIAKKIWFAKQSFIVSVPHILVKNNTPKKGKEKECYLSTTFLLNKTSSTLTLVQKKIPISMPQQATTTHSR